MTYSNKNPNYALDPWTIFSTFSITESDKSNFYSITSSTYFTGEFKLNVDEELLYRFYGTNFKYIFDINDRYPETSIQTLGENDNILVIFKGDLKALLAHEELFKDMMHRKYINNSLFIFHNLKWKDICRQFLVQNIIVSGGSSTRRHIISPVHVKMLIGITAFGFTYQDVVSSFNKISKLKEISMPKDELNFKVSTLMKQAVKKKDVANTNGFIPSSNTSKVNSPLAPSISGINTQNKKYSTSTGNPPSGERNIKNDFSFYLETLKEIINEVNDDPIKAQLKLEESWLSILKERLSEVDNVENIRHKLPSIFKTAKTTLEIASQNGDLKRRFKNLSNEMNNPEFLLLTLGYIISQFKYNKRNVIAMSIANNILYEIFKYKKSEFEDFKSFKIYYGYYNIKTNKDDLTKVGRLGSYFMYLFINDPTSIFGEEFEDNDFESDISLQINPEYSELVRDEIMLHPKTIPMLCKPNPWGENLYGGFLENQSIKDNIITGSIYHKHNMKNMENLYNAVNYLNCIKFSINNDLLNYLDSDKGFSLINLLDNLKLKQSGKEITNSEKLQRNITLKLSEVYRNIPFYLNTHADWRGRIYTHSFFISYQGGDLNSAVLQFWDGESLTESGLDYFYIYGANCYGKDGLDKKTFEIRIKWVKENINKIIELDPEFIANAESPYLFLAFSLSLSELQKDSKAIIKLPVFLDATCSGIQHLSGLLADFTLGNNVNLVPSDNINDIYSTLLGPINSEINKFGKENIEFNNLSTIKLTRKIIKKPIMTKVYNVSILGIKDQLISEFKKVNLGEKTIRYEAPGINGRVLLNNTEVLKIASIINKTIFNEFPSLKTIYDYFLKIVRLILKLGIPLIWFTPSGLEITQSYSKSEIYKVSINVRGKSKKMVLKDWINEVDRTKQVNAIIPNIIHSLDASHLINLINSAINNNFTPILTIHDCFGTHPNRMEYLAHEVKKEFIILYSDANFLQTFHNRFIQSIKDNNFTIIEKHNSSIVVFENKKLDIPAYPKIGKLEIKNIINSKYMIM